MDSKSQDFEDRLQELEQNIRMFRERFKEGTKDPSSFMTLSDIERMWAELSNSTEVIYSDIVKDLLSEIDEKSLVKEKNEFRRHGIILKTDRRCNRSILTTRGKITISRNVLIPADKESASKLKESFGCNSVAPLDMYLGIDGLPFKISPSMMLVMAFWSQNQGSYQAAEDMIRSIYRIDVNDDTIRLVCNYVGGLVFEEDCRRARDAKDMLCNKAIVKPPYRTKANSSTLYIEMDGAAINTRTEDEDGSTWRENKLGIIFSSDDIHLYRNARTGEKCHKITKREYVPFLGTRFPEQTLAYLTPFFVL